MIVSRYLLKEMFSTLLAVTFVLLLIFMSQQLVRYLGYAASGKIAARVLFQIISFQIPILLGLLLPLGLFLAVLLTYGRLYADNELRVLHACGFSMRQLVLVTSMLAVFVMIVVAILMLWVNPLITANKEKMLAQNSANTVLDTLMPGRFQVSSDGRRVIYVEKMTRNHHQANNLFIAEQGKNSGEENTPWVVLAAANGYQAIDAATQHVFVVAREGNRYEGVPGQNDYKMIQFKKYAVRMPDSISSPTLIQEAIPTSQLIKNYQKPVNASELQWRISVPLSAIILALLAVPLCQVKPRKGRYLMLLPGILIYVVYMNLLFVGRHLIEFNIVPSLVGLLWVHLLALLLFCGLMFDWRSGPI